MWGRSGWGGGMHVFFTDLVAEELRIQVWLAIKPSQSALGTQSQDAAGEKNLRTDQSFFFN